MRFILPLSAAMFLMLAAAPVAADEEGCLGVLALAKTTHRTFHAQNELQQHVQTFCSAYNAYKQTGKKDDVGVSYEALSFDYGGSQMSIEQVASRYCSYSGSYVARNDAFQQHVEFIAPQSWQAYQACISAGTHGLHFSVDAQSDTEAVVSVRFVVGGQDDEAELAYGRSEGLTCQWEGGRSGWFNSKETTLRGASTVSLACTRRDLEADANIRIRRTDAGDQKTFVLPWAGTGGPQRRLAELEERLRKIEIPADQRILMTAAADCPTGYTKHAALEGRFVYGSSAGRPTGTAAGAEKVTLQAANLPPHAHGIGSGMSKNDVNAPGNVGSDWIDARWHRNTDNGPGTSQPFDILPPLLALTPCIAN